MIYRSGNFSLDTQSFAFTRDGQSIAIEPQVFDLLVYLMDNRDRVIGRDELLEQLWNGRIVTDNALNGRLKIARKAIGDDGRQQRMIKTVPRRGYQFIADVEIDSPVAREPVTPAPRSEGASSRPSIAVLPFEYVGGDPDREYLADGLSQEITANLCHYRDLLVINRESTMLIDGGDKDLAKLAAVLGVDYLACGTVRQFDGRVRVSIRLLNTENFETIWADHFDDDLAGLFEIEDRVASSIASVLVRHIEHRAHRRALRKRPENMTAYDCTMRGKKHMDSWDPELTAESRLHFERAISLDPEYAPARAYLAFTYCIEAEVPWGMDRDAAVARAFDHAEKAVRFDEFDSDAHVAMGWVFQLQRKFELAESQLDRAIACNPNLYGAYCVKGWVLAVCGRAAEAEQCEANAIRLNPLAPDGCLVTIVLAKYLQRDYVAALQVFSRIKENFIDAIAMQAACLAQLGRVREAKDAAEKALSQNRDYIRQGDWIRGWAFRNPEDFEHVLDGFYKSGLLPDPSTLTDNPSLAVLRFANLSADPEQKYFSDGLAANICARLSRFRSLRVHSAIEFDTREKSSLQLAAELGVVYLLKGTVQREGEQVRIFVELLDGRSNEIAWSETFDRAGGSVMDIQDDVARAVAGSLWSSRGSLRAAERARTFRKITEDFNAFDYILKGQYHKEKYSAEGLSEAHRCFARAVEIDPDCAEALGWDAWVHICDMVMGYTDDPEHSLSEAFEKARRAIEIDPDSEMGHWALADALITQGNYEMGLAQYDKAIEINPNNPDIIVTKGTELAMCGRHDEGLRLIEEGIAFNRHPPEWYAWHLGIAQFCAGHFEQAITAFNRMNQHNKDTHSYLAACYGLLDKMESASQHVAELMRLDEAINPGRIVDLHDNLPNDVLQNLADGLDAAFHFAAFPEYPKLVEASHRP